MKPTNNNNRIFGPSGCLSKEGLSLYLKNELTEKEKNLFEKHVAGCLFCNEALEGFEKHPDNDMTFAELQSIKNDFKTKLTASGRKTLKKSNNQRTLITTISIAASILLIITGYYFINITTKKTHTDLSYNAPKPVENTISGKQKNTVTEKSTEVQDIATAETKEEGIRNNKSSTISEGVLQAPEQSKSRAPSSVEYSGETQNEDDRKYIYKTDNEIAQNNKGLYRSVSDEIAQDEKLTETITDSLSLKGTGTDIALSQDQSVVNEIVSKKSLSFEKNQKNKAGKKEAEMAPAAGAATSSDKPQSLNTGLMYFESARYKEAITELEKTVANNKNDFQATYYLAMAYYNDGQKEAAMTWFDKLLNKKTNPYYDLALWQKALIFTESNQTDEARGLLNEIVKRGGTLKNNAVQKINEIDKSE